MAGDSILSSTAFLLDDSSLGLASGLPYHGFGETSSREHFGEGSLAPAPPPPEHSLARAPRAVQLAFPDPRPAFQSALGAPPHPAQLLGTTEDPQDLPVFSPHPSPLSDTTTESDGSYGGGGTAVAADSSQSAAKAYIPCKVCGDKASGYHYGVTSCEGCKGFFRRSIQKQIEYRCLRDGKCLVFRLNRNRCQYCRFKKCLAVGMSRDSVRYGRVPKRSRERLEEGRADEVPPTAEAAAEAAAEASELEKHQLALYDVILSVSQAHHTNCPYTEDKVKNIRPRPIALDAGAEEADPDGRRAAMWQTLAQFTTPEIQRVVEFAKSIPGFTELEQEDQLVLVKGGFFEVWLVRLARMFNPGQGTLTLADGSFLSPAQLQTMYTTELVGGMQSLGSALSALQLNDGELGLFSGVVLLSGDRAGLRAPQRVAQLQERLTEALKLQLSRSRASDPHVYPNLAAKLPQLRSLGALHHQVMGWYRAQWRRLALPPLFAEIFDIPTNDDAALAQHHALHAPPQPLYAPPPHTDLHHTPTPLTPNHHSMPALPVSQPHLFKEEAYKAEPDF